MTATPSIAGRGLGERSASGHRQFTLAMLYSLPLLLATAVYGYAVTLPFFLDDGPHFAILAQTNGLRHWGDFPAFPFYRPLTFTLWKAFEPFGYSAPVLHWLNVLCFGLAAVLAGQITRLLTQRPNRRGLSALVAGCFVVIFPFSYQAVAMVAAFFHLTLALGVSLSVWALLRWRQTHSRTMLALCWFGAFVAAFSHESGVLVLPLLIGVFVVASWTRFAAPLQAMRVLVPVALIVAVYVGFWLAFDPQDEGGLTEDLPAALAVLAQGLIYPVAALLRPFVDGDIDPLLLLALVLIVTLPPLTWLLWRDRSTGLAAGYGLVWYGMAILPASLFLSAGYVLGQPRLALLASLGGAIFWGLLVGQVMVPATGTWMRAQNVPSVMMASLALIVSAYIALDFLAQRRADFTRLRDYNRDLIALVAANNGTDSDVLLINVPDYVTPADADRRFLLGTEGVLYVDETLDWAQQLRLNSDHDYPNVQVIAVPSLQRSEGFNFSAHPPALETDTLVAQVREAGQIYLTQFDGRDFYPALVGGTDLATESAGPALATFAEGAFVLQAAHADYDQQQHRVSVRLDWQTNEPAPVKAFVHVLCDGLMVAQADGYPWGDTYPFAAWSPGEAQTDLRLIALSAPVTRACLQVNVGLYTEADVIRLTATHPDGQSYTDDAVPIPVNLVPESDP